MSKEQNKRDEINKLFESILNDPILSLSNDIIRKVKWVVGFYDSRINKMLSKMINNCPEPANYVSSDGLLLLSESVRSKLGLMQGGGIGFMQNKETGLFEVWTHRETSKWLSGEAIYVDLHKGFEFHYNSQKSNKAAALPQKELTEDEIAFGVDQWIYCTQHVKPHLTGWCGVSNRDKVGLGIPLGDRAKSVKLAYEKCEDLGFDIFNYNKKG